MPSRIRIHDPAERCSQCLSIGECRKGHKFYSHGKPGSPQDCPYCRSEFGLRVGGRLRGLGLEHGNTNWIEQESPAETDEQISYELPPCTVCGMPLRLSDKNTAVICENGHWIVNQIVASTDADRDDGQAVEDESTVVSVYDQVMSEVNFAAYRRRIAHQIRQAANEYDVTRLANFDGSLAFDYFAWFTELAEHAMTASSPTVLEAYIRAFREQYMSDKAELLRSQISVAYTRQATLEQARQHELANPPAMLAIEAAPQEDEPKPVRHYSSGWGSVATGPLATSLLMASYGRREQKARRGTCQIKHGFLGGNSEARYVVTGSANGTDFSVRVCSERCARKAFSTLSQKNVEDISVSELE